MWIDIKCNKLSMIYTNDSLWIINSTSKKVHFVENDLWRSRYVVSHNVTWNNLYHCLKRESVMSLEVDSLIISRKIMKGKWRGERHGTNTNRSEYHHVFLVCPPPLCVRNTCRNKNKTTSMLSIRCRKFSSLSSHPID